MDKYKILACAGFGYTGSSIVSDYLSEYENIDVRAGSFEFRFLHDYGGVSFLEDSLVNNYHKQSSDGAIHQFLKLIDYYSGNIFAKKYNKWFGGKFKDISEEFVDELIDANWKGWLETHAIEQSSLVRLICYQIIPRIKHFVYRGRIAHYYPQDMIYFSSPNKEYFQYCVKLYLNKLFSVIDPNHEKEYLYFDQIVPPTNIERYLDYFDDIKVIVVDRDPRDLYIQNKFLTKESWIPNDVNTFIKVYRGQRRNIVKEPRNSNVMRINFEYAIYYYEDFENEIMAFLGLNKLQHINPKKSFNPMISIKNTKLWEKYDIDQRDLDRISEDLKEYCFQFD